jgi:AAA+ ATPase superfamily predicted ATPase
LVSKNAEQKQLERLYQQDGNAMILLYGSIRSNKEQLLKDFLEGKQAFYYRARNASQEEQLYHFHREVEQKYHMQMEKSYDDIFDHLRSKNQEKFVLVIDEYQNIARRDSACFQSLLKLKKKRTGGIFIILCNSSVAWTMKEMEECCGTDYKQIDVTMKLQDATFLDVVRAFPSFKVEECVKTYGILGGVDRYLEYWNPRKSIRDNICEVILDAKGPLHHEAEDFIGSELRELSVYDTILSSIARGNEKLNDLHQDTGYSRAKISVYMKNLAAFDVIEKVVSFDTGGWSNAKKGVYRIKNHFIAFWFRFVYPHLSDLYMMEPKEFYQAYIARDLDDYLRRYFVDVCHEYLSLLNMMGKLPIHVQSMGTWIGKTGTIDVVGEDDVRNHIVGVCNWERPTITYEQYEKLQEDMALARIKATTIYLFSAKSFDPRLVKLASEDESVILVDMKEL